MPDFGDFMNEQVRHMFDEIDYILEAKNAERFASLYSSHPRKFSSTCNKHNMFIRCRSLYIFLVSWCATSYIMFSPVIRGLLACWDINVF